MTLFLAGVLLGLAGSAHCVFMCGPLVLTAHCATTTSRSLVPWFVPYHTGRLLTYELLALAAGLAGRVVALGGMGRALSVVCGLLLLMAAAGKAPPLIARRVTGAWARARRPHRDADRHATQANLQRFLDSQVVRDRVIAARGPLDHTGGFQTLWRAHLTNLGPHDFALSNDRASSWRY